MLSKLLKRFLLSCPTIKPALILVFICAFFIFNLNCGKRKPPLPPVERIPQRIQIEGFQRGNRVNLRWVMPARNAAESNISNIARIDIYRLAEGLNSSLTLTEDEFSARSTLIASLPVNNNDFGLKKYTFADVLEFAGQNARLRYGIRFVNAAGQKASFSNFLLIEPTAKVAEAPKSLTVESTEPANILKWLPPQTNVDGTEPVNILGYNVYRSKSENETAALLNKNPVNQTEYRDTDFEFGTKYLYFVRSVSLGGSGDSLESVESNIVGITPGDIFPPSPPSAITIAAAPHNLSIFFATNTESDITGYRIYRSTDKNSALEKWQNITPVLLTTNTFQDTDVESGKTYYYYLTAVDKAGNISQPSEIVSETLP